MAGAVGIEVISPMPMAPPATESPSFSTTMDWISGGIRGLTVLVDRVLLRERVAHAHHDAALNLPFAAQGVHGLAHVVRRDHLFDAPRLAVEDAHLRGVAVGDVADRIRHVRAKRVGFREVFPVELLSYQVL